MTFYRLDPAAQRKRATAELLSYLRDVVARYHPYYRKRWAGMPLRTFDDFLRLPVVSKADYREDPRAFVLQPKFPGRETKYETEPIGLARYVWRALVTPDPSADYGPVPFRERIKRRVMDEWLPIHMQGSTGTTGDPTPVFCTRWEFDRVLRRLASGASLLSYPRPDGRPALTRETRCMSLFPGVPHLAFYQGVISRMLGGLFVFDTCGGKAVPTERQVRLFAQGKFNTLFGVPSYVLHWLRTAAAMVKSGEIAPLDSLFATLVGAEPVSPAIRGSLKALAREVGAHPGFYVVEGYGMTEMKWTFPECDEGAGVHLNPKYWFWEILDKDTLRPVPEGREGVLVFSHIGWRGTVFVRYNTGDLIQGGLVWNRCDRCGLTFPRIRGPIVRATRDFTKIKGTRVSLLELQEAVRATPGVRNFQIVLDKEKAGDELSRDFVRIRVLPENGGGSALADAVRESVARAAGFTPDDVSFDPALEQDLFVRTGIKAEYVVEKRPLHL